MKNAITMIGGVVIFVAGFVTGAYLMVYHDYKEGFRTLGKSTENNDKDDEVHGFKECEIKGFCG